MLILFQFAILETLSDETGIQNSNSDEKYSTGQEDVALEYSPTSSENTTTSSLCKDILLLLHGMEHIIVYFVSIFLHVMLYKRDIAKGKYKQTCK